MVDGIWRSPTNLVARLSDNSHLAAVVAGGAYTDGVSGIWYQWMWLFTTPFYWLLVPVFRRLRVVTTAEFFELRYGRRFAIAHAIFCIYVLALWQGIAVKGTSVTISAITGLPGWWLAVAVSVPFAIYGIAGADISSGASIPAPRRLVSEGLVIQGKPGPRGRTDYKITAQAAGG